MIKENETRLKTRISPKVHTKYTSNGSRVVHEKTKAYEYYICDYCKGEIRIDDKKIDKTGGIIEYRKMKLVLHNRCLKFMLKEYEV